MPVSTDNSGKYLTKTWQEMRQRADQDPTQFTAQELAWLEITATPVPTGQLNPEMYQVEVQPLDTRGEKKIVDIRGADAK
jgi:hypothetical protein